MFGNQQSTLIRAIPPLPIYGTVLLSRQNNAVNHSKRH